MQDKIKQDLKTAMLAHDEVKVSTLRMLLSEVKNAAIFKGSELTDQDIVSAVQTELKKRREAVAAFGKAGREDAASKEASEAEILESYLPAQISDEQLTVVVATVINETGAKSIQDMGRVIGTVMERVGQQADGTRVSSMVKEKLAR